MQPTLSRLRWSCWTPRSSNGPVGPPGVRDAVSRAAKPMQRYRCAACGFRGPALLLAMPGCLTWDSFPPQQIRSL